MRNLILYIIIFFASWQSFGQDLANYEFDYSTLYHIKNEQSEIVTKRYIIGNSKDDTYFLYIHATAIDSTSSMNLYDTKNSRQYEFKINKKPINSIVSFSNLTTTYSIYKYDFARKIDKDRIFAIQYENIDNQEVITVKVFKNKRRKKLISKIQYFMNESDIVKNQFYINDIVFARAFPMREIKTKGVLNKQLTFDSKSDAVKQTRELIEIKPIDININLKTEPVFTRTSLIIQYR